MIAKNSLPQHVAIIPDGNRRWAKKRGLPGWEGHLEAAKRIEEIAKEEFARTLEDYARRERRFGK